MARSQPAQKTVRSASLGAGVVALALAAGLFLAALNLRAAIASVSPLLDVIRSQVHLGHAVAGPLTTIPTLCCIGVGAFLVPPLAARAAPFATYGVVSLLPIVLATRLAPAVHVEREVL